MKKYSGLLKIAVSGGLLIYLFSIVDVQKMFEVLRTCDVRYLFLAALLYCFCIIVISLRWYLMLAIQDIAISFPKIIQYYFTAFFFNNFLPTSIGGDVFRIYKSAKVSSKKAESFAAVVMERLVGFLAILVLANVGLYFTAPILQNTVLTLSALILLLVLLITIFVVIKSRSLVFFEKLTASFTWRGLGEKIQQLFDAFNFYKNKLSTLFVVFVISLVYQSLMMIFAFFANESIHLGVNLKAFMLCVPIIAMLGMLPSINGLGVRETGFVYLLSRLGKADGTPVTYSDALSFSIVILGIGIVVSLIGGIFFLFDKGKDNMQKIKSSIGEPLVES